MHNNTYKHKFTCIEKAPAFAIWWNQSHCAYLKLNEKSVYSGLVFSAITLKYKEALP